MQCRLRDFLKALKEQIEKQVGALKSLDLSNINDELKQVKGIFPPSLINDLIRVKLKEVVNLKDIIKRNDLNYELKHGKTYKFGRYSLPIVFKRYTLRIFIIRISKIILLLN